MGNRLTKTQRAELRREQQRKAKSQREYDRAMSRGLGLTTKRANSKPPQISPVPFRRDTPDYPSLESFEGDCNYREPQQYTGDRLLGIGTMHKSNLVPIFSQDEAEDISKMRRN